MVIIEYIIILPNIPVIAHNKSEICHTFCLIKIVMAYIALNLAEVN